MAIAFLAGPGNADEQVTLRITPRPFPDPAGCTQLGCGLGSAEYPSKPVYETMNVTSCFVSFADPVPVGATVTAMDMKVAYVPTYSPEVVDFYRYRFGLPSYLFAGSFITQVTTYPTPCVPEERVRVAQIVGTPITEGLLGYTYGGINNLIAMTDESFFLGVEFVDITIHYKRPPKIEFDLGPTSDAIERKVLIHRWRDDDSYHAEAQRTLPGDDADRDRRIRIAGTVTDDAGPVANASIYLRVVDPPDTSAYVPLSARQIGDNADRAGGTLDASMVMTDESGRFQTILTVTDHAAGDNYQIEASSIRDFGSRSTCDAVNDCYKSGVFTAVKRVYLEVDRMFRAGAMLTQDVPVCTTGCGPTTLIHVDDARALGNARRLRLVHGPRYDGRGAPFFYSEDVDVIRINRRDDSVEITTPVNPYFGPDKLVPQGDPVPYLADAVGVITGVSAADFFDVNRSSIPDLMSPATWNT